MAKKKRKNSTRYLKDIMEKRYMFLMVLIILLFTVISLRLFKLQVLDNDKYLNTLVEVVEKPILGESAPRGRIYDRNHTLLVDNKAIKTIYYKKEKGITTKEEIELAYKVADIIDLDLNKLSDNMLRNFWVINNKEEANKKITDTEWKKYKERKLTTDNIDSLKKERITEEELNVYTDTDKKAAYIYYLMNKGYSYALKIIKNENVTEREYAIISENISELKGFNTKLDWERVYLYNDTFKTILGKVSSEKQGIPAELKDYYLKNGYSLNDRVGISYLEYQYENYLKGEKAKYKVLPDNTYELVEKGKRGNDIILTIDINLQKALEDILSYEVMKAKGDKNTEYYNRSYVVIEDPKTGEILAMSGKQVIQNESGGYEIIDTTSGIITSSVTPGSIVKGASMSVGYKYGAIKIGTTMKDECIKIKSTPLKCSWKNLGTLNDISALAYSSNSYQFKIAMKVAGANYKYDAPLSIDTSAFEKYRDMYASYGLGVKSGIDLPNESLGYKGTSLLGGHLLDFSIGQYDTYTPIELAQYIATLANSGTRVKPYLLKEVYAPSEENTQFGSLIYQAKTEVLGTVDLDSAYIKRVQEGFHAVMSALGSGYMGNYTNSAGKTGTSQSFLDTDNDGVIDTETITQTFGGYAPYDNPQMSMVVISPDISHNQNGSNYNSSVNKRISSQVANKFFEMIKRQ